MLPRQPRRSGPPSGGFDFNPEAPPAIWVLLGVVFLTFTLSFFESTAGWLSLFRLTPAVYQTGLLWQLLTYGFVGFGRPDFWFLLQLFMLFWFGRDAYLPLGGGRFWRLLVVGTVAAGLVAALVDWGLAVEGAFPARVPFVLIQGQQVLMIVLVAIFALLNRYATVYVFFVLPVQARWFLPLEILLGFLGFLWSKDLGGFLGLSAAVAVTAWQLSGRGPRGGLRGFRLRLEERFLKARLGWLKRRRGLTVIQGGEGGAPGNGGNGGNGKVHRGPWVN